MAASSPCLSAGRFQLELCTPSDSSVYVHSDELYRNNDFPGVSGEFVDLRLLSTSIKHLRSCDILMRGPAEGKNHSAPEAAKQPR